MLQSGSKLQSVEENSFHSLQHYQYRYAILETALE
jgi:hypothetical protein